MSYRPTAEEFEKPTPQLLSWLENSLSYYQQQGNEKAIAVFQSLLEDAKQKANIITRSASWPTKRASENIIPRNGATMSMLERIMCARRTNDEPEPQTHLGFLRMLDTTYQQYVENGSVEKHDRIPYGFGEMLEATFPHGNPMTPHDKPLVVRRGMGFANMLECASKGTE